MVLTFESADEILKCDHSNESHQAVFFGTGVLLACCIARIHVLCSFLIMRDNWQHKRGVNFTWLSLLFQILSLSNLTCHQRGKVIILLLWGQTKDWLVITRTVQHPASTVLSQVVLYSLQISYNFKQRTLRSANNVHWNIWWNDFETQVKTLHIWLPHLHILFWTFQQFDVFLL